MLIVKYLNNVLLLNVYTRGLYMKSLIALNMVEYFKTNQELIIENEDLKCKLYLLELKVASLERNKEIDLLNDILELSKRQLDYIERQNKLYIECDEIIKDTEQLLKDFSKDNDLFK